MMHQGPYTFLLLEDHPLFREAMRNILLHLYPASECKECNTLNEAVELLNASTHIDLALVDLSTPQSNKFSALIALRSAFPSVPILIVSAIDDPVMINECFSHGIVGYLPKSSSTDIMEAALRLVMSGGIYVPSETLVLSRQSPKLTSLAGISEVDGDQSLTARQIQVLSDLSQGHSNKVIARSLGISEITVKAHVSAILRKLNVSNRVQAVLAAKHVLDHD